MSSHTVRRIPCNAVLQHLLCRTAAFNTIIPYLYLSISPLRPLVLSVVYRTVAYDNSAPYLYLRISPLRPLVLSIVEVEPDLTAHPLDGHVVPGAVVQPGRDR